MHILCLQMQEISRLRGATRELSDCPLNPFGPIRYENLASSGA